ncbi:1298_t:CDS:2, partial [Paraglomus occultum]
TCLSKSTAVFTNFAVVVSVYYAIKGNRSYAMLGIAMATYLSLYPVTVVAPIILLLHQKIPGKSIVVHCIILFIGWLSGLVGLSYLLVGSWDFLSATYGFMQVKSRFVYVNLLLPDLSPNIGLFWYFFIEMFDQFRNFFLVVFQLHTLIFAAPLTIKFRDHPLFAIFVLSGITAVFKSYPSIGDASLYIAFLPIYSEIVNYMRYSFLITNIFLYSSLLAPIFYHLWIYAGSGNANFFYAITLVYSVGNIILLVDASYAMLRREFDIQHPELKGREVTQK